jgi:hypothetical protein
MVKIKKIDGDRCRQGCQEIEASGIAGGNVERATDLENSLAAS